VPEFDEVVGSSGHAAVDILSPGNMVDQILGYDTVPLIGGAVHSSREVNVIDLSAEICLTGTEE
jgi:hypothetical protein